MATVAALPSPVPAFAVEYLTFDEAQAALFPEAQRFELVELTLDDAIRQKLQASLRMPVRSRWVVRVARRSDQVVGAAVIDDVIGKFDRITFAAGVGSDGALRQVEILAYRESHGGEVRLQRWRSQFAGKTAASTLRVGDDIANISGATLSCQHVTDGVRRIVAVLDAFRKAGKLG